MSDIDSIPTLATSESILIDGANAVTSAPRAHFPHGGLWLGLAFIVVVVARLLKRPALTVVLLLLAAVPGLIHVVVLRADAPVQRGALAASIATTLSSLQAQVPWPQRQVSVVREDDLFFPLGRYALPSRTVGPIEVELRNGPLGHGCREEAQRVICGSAR